MKNLLAIFLAFTLIAGCTATTCNKDVIRESFPYEVYLSGPYSAKEIEERQLKTITIDGDIIKLPFGRLNSEWNTLKREMRPGDCWMYFRTDASTWEAFHGREGYILVRNNKPVNAILTSMN